MRGSDFGVIPDPAIYVALACVGIVALAILAGVGWGVYELAALVF